MIYGYDWLVVEFQPIWKICASQNGFIFPKLRGENNTYLSCHHRSDDVSVSKICCSPGSGDSKKNRTCFLIITALTYQKLNTFIRLIKHTTYVNRLVTMLWCNDCFYWDFNKYILIIVLMLKILQTRSSNQMMIWYTQTTLFWDECFESLVNDGHNTKHEQKLKHVHSWQHTYKIS